MRKHPGEGRAWFWGVQQVCARAFLRRKPHRPASLFIIGPRGCPGQGIFEPKREEIRPGSRHTVCVDTASFIREELMSRTWLSIVVAATLVAISGSIFLARRLVLGVESAGPV